jgi:uncharacterized protein (DUF362 family)
MGTSGLAVGALGLSGCSAGLKTAQYAAGTGKSQQISGASTVSLANNSDRRQAIYDSLKPLRSDVSRAIGEKQVIIKVNAGFPTEPHRNHSTDPGQIEGIIQFLREFYDGEIWISEGVGSSETNDMMDGFELYGYLPVAREFPGIRFVDANATPLVRKWIRQWHQYPVPIDIIAMYFDPGNYIISAARLKTHNAVVGTYSLKNVVMGAPVGNFRNSPNQKGLMHGGTREEGASGRELSYNMFRLALEGVYPDLAVVDGIAAIEGNGPWDGTEVNHNLSLASTDFVACDRVCTEVMGIDPFYMKYLEWCGDAGLGNWSMDNIRTVGADLRANIIKYRLHETVGEQTAWIDRNFEKPAT